MTRAQFLGLLLSAASLPARAECGVYCARRYGAKADGKSDDTRAIQAAVDAAAKSGGGIVRLSGGVFLSGTVYLRDNIGLEILPGAKLKASADKNLYNRDDFCPQNAAIESERASGAHLLVALEAENVSVFGGGEIDGSGLDFWMQVPENASVKFPRKFAYPRWRPGQMLFFCECRGVSVRNVRLSNAPFWTCFFHGCSDVFASGLSIKNDPRGHNNDGIDIDSCSRAVVSECSVSTEDDCITVRANPSRLKNANATCEDVAISGCVLQSTCNGVRIGVGSGRIRRCSIDNIIVKNTFQGISFIGAYHGRGGAQIEDVRISDALIRAMRPLNMLSDSFNWGRSGARASIRNRLFVRRGQVEHNRRTSRKKHIRHNFQKLRLRDVGRGSDTEESRAGPQLGGLEEKRRLRSRGDYAAVRERHFVRRLPPENFRRGFPVEGGGGRVRRGKLRIPKLSFLTLGAQKKRGLLPPFFTLRSYFFSE